MDALRLSSAGLTRSSQVALALTLVGYPALYCAGFMGPIVNSLLNGSRVHWWQFWGVNMVLHLGAFAVVVFALRQSGENWSSVGLDTGWWKKHRMTWGFLLALLLLGAWVLPGVYYGADPPLLSGTHFMGPVSRGERLFVIAGSLVVGFTEEVLFRGFALTRLARIMPAAAAVVVSTVSFVFIHGTPRSLEGAFSYVAASLLFAVPFVLMKYRRLEWLIFIHVLIDASLALAP
ncbi:MAG: CPBP family intramembrane metalloprotease [Cyclobacteriaceae bacterium]|nr:CPBP family intramembrane metalloprotease [Cyclobacteriaceae bacterium]